MEKFAYTFNIKRKKYEVYFANEDQVEIYELEDPGKTGFIFPDKKSFNMFINSVTDIAEIKDMEEIHG